MGAQAGSDRSEEKLAGGGPAACETVEGGPGDPSSVTSLSHDPGWLF